MNPSSACTAPKIQRLPAMSWVFYCFSPVHFKTPPLLLLMLVLSIPVPTFPEAPPPFWGTIFINPDIVTPKDPTAYERLEDAGRGMRRMFDRRTDDWVNLNAFLFTAYFSDGLKIEVQVNPEFETATAAREEILKYLHAIGQLPTALRKDVHTIWLHKGLKPYGGGNNNLLIHTGQSEEYLAKGILEETFFHEAAHTSLDAEHSGAQGWVEAQKKDPVFISKYSKEHPTREDVAESFLPYFAVRYRADRIPESLRKKIVESIPNRIAYFDAQNFDLYPLVKKGREAPVADGAK